MGRTSGSIFDGNYLNGDHVGGKLWQGTSASTPLAAGAAALMLSVDPKLTASQVPTSSSTRRTEVRT
jgi:subtilisin family serine protease